MDAQLTVLPVVTTDFSREGHSLEAPAMLKSPGLVAEPSSSKGAQFVTTFRVFPMILKIATRRVREG